MVDFLVLDDGAPHLAGQRCQRCAATFLERRSACAACGATAFDRVRLAERGRIESFTVVHRGAPKATGPFISAVVRLDDGVYVKANLLDVRPDPGSVDCERPVRLRTYLAGADVEGTEAIAFGFAYEPDGAR